MLGFSLGKSSSVAYVRVKFISYALLGLRFGRYIYVRLQFDSYRMLGFTFEARKESN